MTARAPRRPSPALLLQRPGLAPERCATECSDSFSFARAASPAPQKLPEIQSPSPTLQGPGTQKTGPVRAWFFLKTANVTGFLGAQHGEGVGPGSRSLGFFFCMVGGRGEVLPWEPSQWGVVTQREAAGKGRSWREVGRGLCTFPPGVSCLESTENVCSVEVTLPRAESQPATQWPVIRTAQPTPCFQAGRLGVGRGDTTSSPDEGYARR